MVNANKILHYMFFCHRLPQRSFFYKGKQFPICARCTGILVGYIMGILYFLIVKKHNFFIEVSLLLPLIIDGFGQYLGYFISTNRRRFITGILAGIAAIAIFRLIALTGINHGMAIRRFLSK